MEHKLELIIEKIIKLGTELLSSVWGHLWRKVKSWNNLFDSLVQQAANKSAVSDNMSEWVQYYYIQKQYKNFFDKG